MSVTISTHNGPTVARLHNIREERVVSKESHIDMSGVSEIWHDEEPRAAYERIFGEAVAAYNAKQKRADRKIESYYAEVCADERRHPVYEMIIGVYGEEATPRQRYEIMREFVEGWTKRNPNLELIGAYYHADEEGSPHVHIDYVPVASGYQRGMELQCGLDRALTQMGFESKNHKQTAQMSWERRENDLLDELCQKRGLEVSHPGRCSGAEHLKTDVYKLRCQITDLRRLMEQERTEQESERQAWKAEKKAMVTEAQEMISKYEAIKQATQQRTEELEAKVSKVEERLEMGNMALRSLQSEVRLLERKAKEMTEEQLKEALREIQASAARILKDYSPVETDDEIDFGR